MDGERHLGVVLKGEAVAARSLATDNAAGAAAGVAVAGTALDDNRLGRCIKDITVRDSALRHHHGTARNEAGHNHGTVLAGDVLPNDIAVAVLYGELSVGNGLTRHRVQLCQRKAAKRIIVKIEGLGVIRLDLHGLGPVGVADDIAVNGIHLGHDQRTNYALERDLAIFIGVVEAIAGNLAIFIGQKFAAGGGDFEGHTLQRSLLIRRTAFVDNKAASMCVLKNETVGHILLNLDGLGGGIFHIAVRSLLLGDNEDLPRLEAGDGDEAVAICGVPPVVGTNGRAVLIGDMEYCSGQRLLIGNTR